jgi:hypothetical protein
MDKSITPPHALRMPKFPSQALGKDLKVYVDVPPPTNESEQVTRPIDILLLNNQEPIMARGFGT